MNAEDRVVAALAVEGDRIVAAGGEDELWPWATEHGARIVDLDGRALLPGFVDAHGHFPGSGFTAIAADLNSPPIGQVEQIDDVVALLPARAGETDRGDWVLGLGYDDTLIAEKRHPTRDDLARVSREHPVGALHVSGHLAAVNSLGLERLGIGADTPDPEGGLIRRDPATGEPDGVLEETAFDELGAVLFRPSPLDSWRIVRRATEEYLAQGVTTAQNGFATAEQIRGLALLSRLGQLPLRLVMLPDETAADAIADGTLSVSADPLWLHVAAVKLVADGSIQGYTGYLSEPYFVPPADDPSYRGYPRIPREQLFESVARLHDRGHQLAIHGNGDASIEDILDALEAAFAGQPRDDARPVIIHAQMARDDQLDRMAALGVIPSFFVLHTYYWGDRHRELFMGPERAARMSPTRSAAERGIPFTLHADTPIVPMEPLRIVWSAVNRRSRSDAVIGGGERIDVMRALRGVTIDAARQHFEEADKGSLESGKLADLVILDRSPLDDPARIDEIGVVETVIGGRSVYRAGN
jgi:predicted amidohydrolase YtcJ